MMRIRRVHAVSDVSRAHLDVDRSDDGPREKKTCVVLTCRSFFAYNISMWYHHMLCVWNMAGSMCTIFEYNY